METQTITHIPYYLMLVRRLFQEQVHHSANFCSRNNDIQIKACLASLLKYKVSRCKILRTVYVSHKYVFLSNHFLSFLNTVFTFDVQ